MFADSVPDIFDVHFKCDHNRNYVLDYRTPRLFTLSGRMKRRMKYVRVCVCAVFIPCKAVVERKQMFVGMWMEFNV